MKDKRHIRGFNESDENLNISDVRQRFIDLVQSRIDGLEKDLKITKQGHQYYERIQERIDELNDLLGEMKNVV